MRTNGENIITRHFEGNFTHTSAYLFEVLVIAMVLTAHAEVIANRGVLKVQMPGCALIPAGMLPSNGGKVEETIASLWYLRTKETGDVRQRVTE